MAKSGNSGDSAKSGDSTQGWPGLLAELQKSFNLLRDVFGYAMPGAVFLSIGLLSGRISLRQVNQLLEPYHPPTWAVVILLIIICYVVGQVLAAVAYTVSSVRKYFRAWMNPDDPWVKNHPTEVSGHLLEVQRIYPGFLLALERRETIAIFIGSTMIALLAGALVFWVKFFTLPKTLIAAGLILLVDFWTAMPHLRRVRAAVADAYTEAIEYDKAHEEHKPKPTAKPDDVKQALVELIKAATEAIGKL